MGMRVRKLTASQNDCHSELLARLLLVDFNVITGLSKACQPDVTGKRSGRLTVLSVTEDLVTGILSPLKLAARFRGP